MARCHFFVVIFPVAQGYNRSLTSVQTIPEILVVLPSFYLALQEMSWDLNAVCLSLKILFSLWLLAECFQLPSGIFCMKGQLV